MLSRRRKRYNGGEGGIPARPRPEEEAAERERHVPPSSAQVQHLQTASTNRQLYESVNHGKPPIATTARPAEFTHGVVKAKAAANSYRPPTARTAAAPARNGAPERSASPVHPNDLPAMNRPGPSNTGNSKQDQKYQQQQEKLFAKQQQERQQLQQQTQQLQQKHTSQQQSMQSRQPQQPKSNPRR